MKFKIFLITTIISGLFLLGCSSDDPVTPVPKPEPKPDPTLLLEIGEITSSSVAIIITPTNAEKCAYISLLQSEKQPTAAEIIANGKSIAATGVQTFLIEGLESKTEYAIAAVAINEDGKSVIVTQHIATPEPEKQVLELKDGFMFYDGFDSASGRYRVNVIMSSKLMSDSRKTDFYDVLIWVYTSEDPPLVGDFKRAVPFGKITPFFTDGSVLSDMVYYIGKHKVDEEGKPNFEGTGWVYFNEQGEEEFFVADDTQNTQIEIKDNGNGTYTVFGILVDKTKGRELNFSFTDSKLIAGY